MTSPPSNPTSRAKDSRVCHQFSLPTVCLPQVVVQASHRGEVFKEIINIIVQQTLYDLAHFSIHAPLPPAHRFKIQFPNLSSKLNFGLRKQQVSGSELGTVGVNTGMFTNVKCCATVNIAEYLFFSPPTNCQRLTFDACSGNADQ